MRPTFVVILVTILTTFIISAGTPLSADAAPQWRLVDGSLLALGETRLAVLNQSSLSATLSFKIGAQEYTLKCSRTPLNKGPTELFGGNPGEDALSSLNLIGGRACQVLIGAAAEPNCEVHSVELLGPSKSVLEKVGAVVYDKFTEFVLAWEIVTLGGCPAALTKTFDMENKVQGTVVGRRALTFSAYPVKVEGATNAQFAGEFRFTLGGVAANRSRS
jgi:hypothetical protein